MGGLLGCIVLRGASVPVMDMPTYVKEMEFAARSYFSTLLEEEQKVATLEREVIALTAQTMGGL